MSMGTCTCPGFVTSLIPCKHIFAVLKKFKLSWSHVRSDARQNCPWRPDLQVCTTIDNASKRLSIMPQSDPSNEPTNTASHDIDDDPVPRAVTSRSQDKSVDAPVHYATLEDLKHTVQDKLRKYMSFTYDCNSIEELQKMLVICSNQLDVLMPRVMIHPRLAKTRAKHRPVPKPWHAIPASQSTLQSACIVNVNAANVYARYVMNESLTATKDDGEGQSTGDDGEGQSPDDDRERQSTDDDGEGQSTEENGWIITSPTLPNTITDAIASRSIIRKARARGRPKSTKKARSWSHYEFATRFQAKLKPHGEKEATEGQK
jgi:hypothetical protein